MSKLYTLLNTIISKVNSIPSAVNQALEQAKAGGAFKGDPGYTPQKGTDYWTAADQEAIVQQVITALGTPVFGTVDADNNIILTGELADGTYTIKYEDVNGNVVDIGIYEQGEEEEPVVEIAIPWKEGWYINSDATKADSANATYLSTEEFIEIEDGYTYTLHSKKVANLALYVLWYSSDVYTSYISRSDNLNTIFNSSGGVYTVAAPNGAKYMRLRASTGGTHSDWINNIVLTRYKNE